MATKIAVAPSRRIRSASASSGVVAMPSSCRNLALPSITRRRSTMPMAPWPGGASKPRTGASSILRSAAASTTARPSGCSLLRSTLAASRSISRSSPPSTTCTAITFGLPSRQGAGLVDHQRVDRLHALQRLGVPDQHAVAGAAADADHDRHRRREAQRARAGDDQHGDRRDHAVGVARLRPERGPGRERQHRDQHHRRHEPFGDLVGEPLHRRARALRARHHLHDPRQHGVAADRLGAHDEAAAAVDGAADHLGADHLADRHRLAGHHRLVERRMALDQFAVDRHLVARPHPKLVADRNGVERDHRIAVVGDADRGLRRLIEQRPDRAGGALARAKLQHLADAAPAR